MTATASLSLTVAGLHRTLGPSLSHYVDVARVADDVGIDAVVLADHVVMGERTDRYPYGDFPFAPDEPWAEPLTLLAAMASATERIRLGTGILIAPLRNPVALAKTVATLDALSDGRVDLGVGVGWQREEYDAAGVPWGERWVRLDEGMRAARALWEADGPASFSGDHVRVDGVWSRPTPVQDRLPVWVGARITDARAAEIADWGDGWMPIDGTPLDQLTAGVERLRAAFVAAGRHPGEVRVRFGLPLVRTDEGFDFAATRHAAAELADAGVTTFAVHLRRMADGAEDARPWLEELVEGMQG